jgi:RNA polymerase sigma-70 factor (ECF subfamily)
MTLTEAELVARARLGDEDAFSELYKLHFKGVRAVGRAILHKQDVEDLCQDTFLRAFTRLDRFDGTCTFRTWITRIAINECLVAVRAQRRVTHGESHLVALEDELLALPMVDAQLQGVAGRLDLSRLMQSLPEAERQLVRMVHLDGASLAELADLLGTSKEYVRQKLYRARRRMVRNK